MYENKKIKYLFRNLKYAFLAQGISLLLSLIISLILPKILGIEEFGYWQLFMFYVSYAGFFDLGIPEGIYLRFGGMDHEKLNYSLIGSQFWTNLIIQTTFSGAIILFSLTCVHTPARILVLIAMAICLIINNASYFIGYVLQTVNLTRLYSISVMIDKGFFTASVMVLVLCREKYFGIYIYFYIISKILCLLYCFWIEKKVIFSHFLVAKSIISEIGVNISIGLNLILSNIASMMVLGVGRFVIDRIWGITEFGKFSFALSLTSFFLLFISQVSMVLFPALRQSDEKQLHKFYKTGRDMIGIVLAGIFLSYMPIKYLLGLWLPQYQQSLQYLALLLPLCTFDGKMQMLCSTYLKVLRKERILLAMNLITLAMSVVLSMISGFVLHSIYAIVISMVIAVAFRSILSELYLSKLMQISVIKSIITECFLVVIFMSCTWFISPLWGFLLYLIVYIAFLLFSKNKIINIMQSARAVVVLKQS